MRAERSSKKRSIFRTPQRRAAFWCFLIAVAVILCGSVVVLDNSRVTVDRQTVVLTTLPASAEGFSVLLISDVHGREFGEQHSRIFAALDQTRVDAVVLAGDLCAPGGDPGAFHALIDGLQAHPTTSGKPVFFWGGDEDPPTGEIDGVDWVFTGWVQGAMDRGAVLLESPERVRVGESSVWFFSGRQAIADIDGTVISLHQERDELSSARDASGIDVEREQRISTLGHHIRALERAQEARGLMMPQDIQIGVLHQPFTPSFSATVAELPEDDRARFRAVDVFLAGHYCGGGMRLPILGALHIPAPTLGKGGRWPPQELVRGPSEIADVLQVVTPGLGVSAGQKPFRARMLNTPSITVVRLTGH